MIKIKDIIGLPSLNYHLENGLSLSENVYRYSSERFIQLFAEARDAWRDGLIELNADDAELLESTDIGEYGIFEGEKVPLDLPMLEAEIDYEKEKTWKIQDKFPIEVTVRKGWSGNYYIIEPKPMTISYDTFIDLGSMGDVDYTDYDYTTGEARFTANSLEQIKKWEEENKDRIKVIYPSDLNEAEYKGKDVALNKPKRGGPKKFYVYVKNPKTGKVKKVNFGDSGNLSVKINEPGARASFAARHQCDKKKDKTKPGYWSCNIGRYWKSLGGSRNFSGYW